MMDNYFFFNTFMNTEEVLLNHFFLGACIIML